MTLVNRVIPIFNISRSTIFQISSKRFPCKSVFHWINKASYLNFRYYGTCMENYYTNRLLRNTWNRQFNITSTKLNERCYSDDVDSSAKSFQKVLEDKEFQDILKDFANDFGINEESDKLLEDIRKDNEKQYIKDESTSKKTKDVLDAYQSITKHRFQEFQDTDSSIIYSYEEELNLEPEQKVFHIDQEYDKDFSKYEVKRGLTGVYDIEELVPILKSERCFDVAVIEIPKHYHYADYLVLATAQSLRHIKSVTEFILKFYKMKKDKSDPFIRIEGEKLGNWKVMDMGNIVLHVFLEDIRNYYDIESLWLVDQEFDSGGETEKEFDVMQEELEFLNCLQSENTFSEEEITK